jgi:plasmid stability protein
MAYPEEVDAFEALARDDGHELHLGEEGHLGVGQARWERKRHF